VTDTSLSLEEDGRKGGRWFCYQLVATGQRRVCCMLLLQLTHPLHSPATCSPGAVFIIYNLGVALSGVRHACASSRVFVAFRPVFATVRHCARHHYCALLYGKICVCRCRVSLAIFAFFDRLFRRATRITKFDFVPCRPCLHQLSYVH